MFIKPVIGDNVTMRQNNISSILIAILMLGLAVSVMEAGSKKRRGTAGAQELLIPVGSRGTAMSGAYVAGISGLEAIDALASKYLAAGKRLHLRHLSPDCKKLLAKAGDLVEVSVLEDPDYEIAVDYGHTFDRAEKTT